MRGREGVMEEAERRLGRRVRAGAEAGADSTVDAGSMVRGPSCRATFDLFIRQAGACTEMCCTEEVSEPLSISRHAHGKLRPVRARAPRTSRVRGRCSLEVNVASQHEEGVRACGRLGISSREGL